MTRKNQRFLPAFPIVLLVAAMACQLPQSASLTPTSLPITPLASPVSTTFTTTQPSQTSVTLTPRLTPLPKPAPHLIATHRIYGIAEFYDKQTGKGFIPRGVNYSILVPVQDHDENLLFSPGVYDHARTQADFASLRALGYNTVRILVDECTSASHCIGSGTGTGLDPAYLDNLADLMSVARKTGLFLVLGSSGLPESGGYAALASQGASQSFASLPNIELLTPSGIQASKQYWTDLLTGLITRQAPLEAVLGWELIAEQYYTLDQAPFSMTSGKVTTAQGKTYDLVVTAQRQGLAVDGLRFYIDQLRQTILKYDPTALVTMGFFASDVPNAWREGDNRLVYTAPLLENSSLDFFDLHTYPGAGLTLAQAAQNFGLGGHVTKPVLMGEVGAYTLVYPEAAAGAIAIQDWIAASCTYGFSGWLYEGYNPVPAGMSAATWGFVDAQSTLLNALAPKNQPDACITTTLPGRNLALGKTVTASGGLPDQTMPMAVDGDLNTQWSSGEFPPQWIQIDLGGLFSIGEIRLTVGQWPAGKTVHQLWVGSSPETLRMVQEFKGWANDYDQLDYVPPAPLSNVRYIRVLTTDSPSWVSWREIEALAPFPGTPTTTPGPSLTPTP